MLVEKLTTLKNLLLKRRDESDRIDIVLKEDDVHEDPEMDKNAMDDCIAEKVPKIFDEMPELDPSNKADREQAVAIAADKCRE